MKKGHSSGNGDQAKALLREVAHLRSSIGNLQARIDDVVGLADQEVGLSSVIQNPKPKIQNPAGGPGFGVRDKASYYSSSLSPTMPVPRPDPSSESRIPNPQIVGIPGTPIVGGFLLDLGEYNSELMGRNAMPTYEQMRRGDGQVHATLAACKLPVLSAKWEVVPGLWSGVRSPESKNQEPRTKNPVLNTGAGKQTAAKAREVADFVKGNLFGGLEFRPRQAPG